MEKFIKNLDKVACGHLETMIVTEPRKTLWQDLDLTYTEESTEPARVFSSNMANCFYRLETIAKAYATKGTELYKRSDVKNKLIDALDYMNEHHYNQDKDKTCFFGNWWHWEIGAPIAFLNTAIIIFDDLSPLQIENYTKAVDRFSDICDKSSGYFGSPRAMTAANLIDKGTAVALSGILTGREEKLSHVKGALKSIFEYVTVGDGFYEDGSYIQHHALAFIGGYGQVLYQKLSLFFNVFKASPWELSYEDNSHNMVFDMIFDAIEPFYHKGLMMDMVSGRGITRNTENDRIRGVTVLASILPMIHSASSSYKLRLENFAREIILCDRDYFFENCREITAIVAAEKLILDKADNKADSKKYFCKYFGGMDRFVYKHPDFTFALALCSTRTFGHEYINGEGKQTWNISDGMYHIYTDDKTAYNGGFWATVDPTRYSGVTVEHMVHPEGAWDRKCNTSDLVGGATANRGAVVGMEGTALGVNGERNGATYQKSWFVFDDEILCLGSGITSNTGQKVETVIENRKFPRTEAITYKDNRKQIYKAENLANSVKISANVLHMGWDNEKNGIGYYFTNNAAINLLIETRKDMWENRGFTKGEETASYGTIWLDHGKNPCGASYDYNILPHKTWEETEKRATNSETNILRQDNMIHAAKNKSLGMQGVIFWQGGEALGISAESAVAIFLTEKENFIEVSVADITQKSEKPVCLGFPFSAKKITSNESGVEIICMNMLRISADFSGIAGKTLKFTVEI